MAKKEVKVKSGTSYSGEKTATGIVLTKGAVILSPGSTKTYKTGEWRTFRPTIDRTKCIKCAKCWMNCPDAAIFKETDGTFEVNYDYCKGCLICAKICPVKCISYKVEEK